MDSRLIGQRLTYGLLALFLVIYGLILAKDFLYPIAFGILISYLLFPIVNFFEKKGVPRIASIFMTIILAVAIFVVIAFFVIKKANMFLDELPTFQEKMQSHLISLQNSIQEKFGIPAGRIRKFLLNSIFDIGSKSERIFDATTGTIFALLMQPVYVFLFLYYRTKFAYFILKIVGRQNRIFAVSALREISQVVTRYMLGVTTVVLILCAFNSAGLMIVGLKYPLLLGIISALFSFIPYFGNIIGGLIPFTFAILIEDSASYAARVVIYIFCVHFFENNILSPNIVGNNLNINPFVIILGLILGAMVWGIPGMLVVIPFLAMLRIVIKKIPGLQPYVFLLGTRGTKKHAFTLESVRKFFRNLRNRKVKYNPPDK